MVLNLTCAVCGKSFDNRRSQVRHSSYCRKKARAPLQSRKRSCQSCTTAKARCDAALPACTRCARKSRSCIYGNSANTIATQEPPSENIEQAASPSATGAGNTIDILALETTLSGRSLGLDGFGAQLSVFSEANYGLVESGQPHDWPSILPAKSPRQPTLLQAHLRHENAASTQRLVELNFIGSSPLEPFTPIDRGLAPFTTRAFQLKPNGYSRMSLIRKFIIRQLASYPHRLRPTASVPPFVHATAIASGAGSSNALLGNCMPAPLANASAIISMWSGKNRANCASCWKMLRMEQERLTTNCFLYDDFEAVAAFQATCIYLLLRVTEKDERVTDFDVPLILTMANMAQRAKGISNARCKTSADGLPTWEGWVLAESLRRSIIVGFMIDYFFDMSAGTHYRGCNNAKHWSEMLLPSTKELWAAKTRGEWEREYVRANDRERPTFGDLIKHGAEFGLGDSALDSWLAGVDEFGSLVVASASLVEQDSRLSYVRSMRPVTQETG